MLWSSGGNFLDVLPAPDVTRAALARTPLRVHQDILVTHQMLVEPGETVVLLPAATRYEQEGGGTSTTTERRVAFSPEIPGPRVGEARSEWQIFADVARRVRPDLASQFGCESADAIRAEIARVVPSYAGIERLRETGDAIQVGGDAAVRRRQVPDPDGKAHFAVVAPQRVRRARRPVRAVDPPGQAVQLDGVGREGSAHRCDAATRCSLPTPTRPRSASPKATRCWSAARTARCAHAFTSPPIRPGNVQAFFPEANPLLSPTAREPESGVPDYNAVVEVVPVR